MQTLPVAFVVTFCGCNEPVLIPPSCVCVCDVVCVCWGGGCVCGFVCVPMCVRVCVCVSVSMFYR